MPPIVQRHRRPGRGFHLADAAAPRHDSSEVTVEVSGAQSGATPAETQSTGPLAPVLTVDEVAALLRIERKTAYAAIQRGEIPGVRRIGSILRISRDAVLDWLARGDGPVSYARRRQ